MYPLSELGYYCTSNNSIFFLGELSVTNFAPRFRVFTLREVIRYGARVLLLPRRRYLMQCVLGQRSCLTDQRVL